VVSSVCVFATVKEKTAGVGGGGGGFPAGPLFRVGAEEYSPFTKGHQSWGWGRC
jgi:hypothetical protein